MQKANKVAEASGHSDFKATEGWFYRWKKRFSVAFTIPKGRLNNFALNILFNNFMKKFQTLFTFNW